MEVMTCSQIWESPTSGQLAPQRDVEAYILGIKMLLRDMSLVQSEDFDEQIPVYIGESEMDCTRRQEC